MQSNRSQFAVKWLPSLTDFAFLMPIAFLFGRMEGVKTLLSDCDTGWHIRTGDWIFTNHLVPTHDVFSFTKPGDIWYAWEWLSDLIFSGLNSIGGLPAVVLLSIAILCVTFTMLFRLVSRRANPVVSIAITLIAAAASSVHWLARPHLFTMLFLVVFYTLLERFRERKVGIGALAALPFLTILWTNLHGGFFLGIILIAAYGGAELLKILLSPDGSVRVPAAFSAMEYFVTAGGCLVASLVNPYTYHLHVHLLQYLRDPYASQHIMEFFSLSFHHPVAIFFETMLLLGAAAMFWYGSQGKYLEPLLFVVFGHAGLLAARNIPIFVIIAAPPVAAALEAWLADLPERNVACWLRNAASRFNGVVSGMAEIDRIPRFHAISVLGFALVAALVLAPAPPKRFRSEYDPQSYPARAIERLRAMPSARVFTNDEWGDYLIWRLYPTGKVFVDGRSDFYGADFEEKYIDVLNVKYNWEKILADFKVDTILLPTTASLAGALKESSRWHVVYDDGVALIFRTNSRSAGKTLSAVRKGGGNGRDREVTKIQASDQAITNNKLST